MKRNSTVAAWTCLMLLLMASPAAAQSRTALDAATDKSREQAAVRVVTSSQAVQPNQQSTETDKQLEQVQAQMKELRAEMKQLREKKLQLLAKKHGISTEGKTSKQIHQELREKLGIKGRLFHEKHHINGKHVEDRQTQLQHEEEKHRAEADGLTPEEIKAKFQELNGSVK
ncbi:serine protease [Paenibacillus jamilae]